MKPKYMNKKNIIMDNTLQAEDCNLYNYIYKDEVFFAMYKKTIWMTICNLVMPIYKITRIKMFPAM